MPKSSGREAYLALDNAQGVITDIRDYTDHVGLDEEIEDLDVTTLGDKDAERIPGFINGELPVEGPVDFAAGASHEIFGTFIGAEGTNSKRTYQYGPIGNATGERRYSGESACMSYSITITPDEPISYTATLRADGAITRDTF